MVEAQNLKNHARWYPPFHFFLMPLLLLLLIVGITHAIMFPNDVHIFLAVLTFCVFFTAGLSRGFALKAQDRVIRLEEKMRLASLVSASELAELESLTMKQYIALRFASNPELPELARRAVREKMEPKAIKAAIVSWRADHDRL